MSNFYEAVGGEQTFRAIVHEFYKQVPDDDILGPMYPAEDLDGAENRLRWFLAQYWGGPQEFNEKRGHPRLRMRHMPFAVTPEQRDRWLTHIMAACDAVDLEPELDALLRDYLVRAAYSLVNTPGPEPENPIR